METEAPELTLDCLVCTFAYLSAQELLVAATISKVWNEAAEAAQLWRRLCLNRWTFCNITNLTPGMQTWKKYYLHRSQLERQMISGRGAADYTCKTMRGHNGQIVDMAYLSENDHKFETGTFVSVVCTASTDCTVRAWNIQEGIQMWSSPVQPEKLSQLITLPQEKMALTADVKGTIKVWNGHNGDEMAAFSTNTSKCTMVAFTVDDGTFVSAGTAAGTMYTLTVPGLTEVSRVRVYTDDDVSLLLRSPDKQWIVAGKLHGNSTLPTVYFSGSLTNPSKDEPTISAPLPVSRCSAACWLPAEAAKIAVLDQSPESKITTFDITAKKSKYKMEILAQANQGDHLHMRPLERSMCDVMITMLVLTLTRPGLPCLHTHAGQCAAEVGSFTVPWRGRPSAHMQGHGSDTLLVAQGGELHLYSVSGSKLASFKDHTESITSICVDPFRVITSSTDLSLRVYTWKTDNKAYSLTSRYHLLGGSHRFSRAVTSVACDFVSIACVVEGTDGKDLLRAYSFNI